jgi:NAD(P)-dependent dehydrogenase (short-subunit alcohol dehydrogenase family)
VLVARRKDKLEDLARRIEQAGGRAIAWTCDVTDLVQVEKLPGLVRELTGRPDDVLVNNAGVPGGGPFVELGHDQIDAVVRVNLLAVLHVTRVFLPACSTVGEVTWSTSPRSRGASRRGGIGLLATKHAVVAFSESLDYDTAPRAAYRWR